MDDVNDSNDDDNYTENDENDVTVCDVSLDGSWPRRGYASLNGFVSAIERVSDKVACNYTLVLGPTNYRNTPARYPQDTARDLKKEGCKVNIDIKGYGGGGVDDVTFLAIFSNFCFFAIRAKMQ